MANSSAKPPDLPALQSSLSRLSTAAHLLDGFVHRNKNQHRGTRWWGPFDMLRRGVRKLVPDLESAVQRAEFLSSSAVAPAKRTKTAAKRAQQPELGRVEARAQWVHDVVAAKAFEAFTQLVADRQFAQLGLMLIGVLAQVEAALGPFLKPAEPEDVQVDAAGLDPARVAAVIATRPVVSAAPQVGGIGAQQEDDLGVAISRGDLGGDEEDETASRARRASPQPEHPPLKEKRSNKNEARGKKRLRADDSGSSTIGKPEKPVRPESSKDEKKAKKKKKKKGGDEFDDLFSSLV
ncbi:hypothetical protein diail_4508 [Diaporthe ilicicola]|nr:hypothetical protein diail_4508 [Diaporthe ilicicola]